MAYLVAGKLRHADHPRPPQVPLRSPFPSENWQRIGQSLHPHPICLNNQQAAMQRCLQSFRRCGAGAFVHAVLTLAFNAIVVDCACRHLLHGYVSLYSLVHASSAVTQQLAHAGPAVMQQLGARRPCSGATPGAVHVCGIMSCAPFVVAGRGHHIRVEEGHGRHENQEPSRPRRARLGSTQSTAWQQQQQQQLLQWGNNRGKVLHSTCSNAAQAPDWCAWAPITAYSITA